MFIVDHIPEPCSESTNYIKTVTVTGGTAKKVFIIVSTIYI